jgi:hypothetical protein
MDMEMFGYTPKNQPPRYYNTYEKLEQSHNKETFYSYKKNRNIPIKPQKITNYMFVNHINRTHNLYYINKHIKYGNMLINIDIDIKKSKGNGTKSGAQKFANDLKNIFGNNLYIEESTSGSSYHCYIFVNSEHYTYNETKKCLKRLETYLEYYKTKNNHNIELVEIKGHPGIVIYNENNKIDRIKFGQLAKVPFGINNKLKELINTTKITCTEILSNKFDTPEYEIEKEIITKEIKGSITKKSITKEMLSLLPIYANVFDSLFINKIEIYRNNNRYLRIQPKNGESSSHQGAIVKISYEGKIYKRIIDNGGNAMSQSEPIAHFGLGNYKGGVDVTIKWTDGTKTHMKGVKGNQVVSVVKSTLL